MDNSSTNGSVAPQSRIVYQLLAFFLGSFGVHNFYAGYTTRAVIQLLITLLTVGFGSVISWVWAIIELITVDKNAKGETFAK